MRKMRTTAKKTTAAAVIAALSMSMLSDCGQGTEMNGMMMDLKAAPLQRPYGNESDSARSVALGINEFSFSMGSMLYEEYEGDNFVCSPISLWLPLGALLNASEEEYREELMASLGLKDVTVQEVNEAVSRILYCLTGEDDKGIYEMEGEEYQPALQLANMVFVSKNYHLDGKFAQKYLDYYRGNSMMVDFASGEALEEINRWASQQTHGEIERVLDKLSPDAVAAIANAIYFKDSWEWKFSKEETTQDEFMSPDGTVMADFMVRAGEGQSYYEDERLQAVCLDFARGARMYVLLPVDGNADGLYHSMRAEDLKRIAEGMDHNASGTFKMPSFEIAGDSMDLMTLLDKLNVPLLDALNPVVTGLVTEKEPLYISQAVQKALIRVDEDGTTAAAVTVLAMEAGGAAMMEEPDTIFEMICDRPFLFFLTDNTYDGGDQILFSGVVNRP